MQLDDRAVTLAEERLARGRKPSSPPPRYRPRSPMSRRSRRSLRGACALPDPAAPGLYKRFVLDFRGGPPVRNFVDGAEVKRVRARRVATRTTRSAPRTTR
jgi:hypothetical protein